MKIKTIETLKNYLKLSIIIKKDHTTKKTKKNF